MRNLALFLKYDGTAYHGWQVQKNACSVGADAGGGRGGCRRPSGAYDRLRPDGRRGPRAHLCGQFPHGRPASPCDRVAYALNTHLPADIVVTGAREVPLGFNAIGSCVRKEYTYQIYNSRIRDPFLCEPGMVLSQASGRSRHAARPPRSSSERMISLPSAPSERT